MEKIIPYEKLSKKKKREQDRARRSDWGGLSPVTRRPENPKAYHRSKARKWNDDSSFVPCFSPYAQRRSISPLMSDSLRAPHMYMASTSSVRSFSI